MSRGHRGYNTNPNSSRIVTYLGISMVAAKSDWWDYMSLRFFHVSITAIQGNCSHHPLPFTAIIWAGATTIITSSKGVRGFLSTGL